MADLYVLVHPDVFVFSSAFHFILLTERPWQERQWRESEAWTSLLLDFEHAYVQNQAPLTGVCHNCGEEKENDILRCSDCAHMHTMCFDCMLNLHRQGTMKLHDIQRYHVC